MKFVCDQKNFLETLLIVQKAVSTKSPQAILEGIYIETYKDVLKFVGTDLDLGIESYLRAEILEEGNIVIPSRILLEFVRKLPDAEMEVTVLDNYRVKITCLNSVVTIQGLAPDEYPELPEIKEENPIELDQVLLNEMIKKTIFAIAVDETRPILTGALLEIIDSDIHMVSLDGYRVAIKNSAHNGKEQNRKVLIPGKSLNEIGKIIDEDNQKVSITISNQHVLFDMGLTRIITRILDGEYINYHLLIPSEYKTRAKINASLLESSIERAFLIARDSKNNFIKCMLQDDKMIITSNSETGQVYEEVPILLEGKEIEIAFNPRYLMDILKAIDDEEIYLDMTTSVNPCVIRPIEGNNYIYLLLPVRMYS